MKPKIAKINLTKEIQSIREINEKAKKHNLNASKLIKELTTIVILTITISLTAQSFEKINGLGKTSTEIKILSQELQQIVVGYYPSGELFSSYYDADYGTLVYVFNKANICQRMEIYTHPVRRIDINRMVYSVKTTHEKTRTIHFIKYR